MIWDNEFQSESQENIVQIHKNKIRYVCQKIKLV